MLSLIGKLKAKETRGKRERVMESTVDNAPRKKYEQKERLETILGNSGHCKKTPPERAFSYVV